MEGGADGGTEADGAGAGSDQTSGDTGDANQAEEDKFGDTAVGDVGPSEPLFERGQVIPPDSLPCLNFETGQEQLDCNHHGSSVAVTQDGTVLAVWYHGIGEKSPDSRIVWSRRPKGAQWGPAEVLFDDVHAVVHDLP